MRCLFCDKKLSLLKLAKGDSFCSPEHFDAYQLQMSKNDIERLMGLPIGDAPKAPLIVTPHEEPAGPPPPPKPSLEPPPFATFAKSRLGAFPPEPASPMAEEPVADLRGAQPPALPVRPSGDVTGVLNLHRQLSQEMIGVSDWAPPADNDLQPEEFRGEIATPLESSSPVPENIQVAAGVPEPIAAAPEETAEIGSEEPVVSEVLPTEAAVPEAEVVAAEEITVPVLEDLVISESLLEPILIAAEEIPAPVLEDLLVAEPIPTAVAASAPIPVDAEETAALVESGSPAVEQATASEPVPTAETSSEAVPEAEVAAAAPLPVRQMPQSPRISFVIAPSFVQRAGSFPVLDKAPSSEPVHLELVPQLRAGVPAQLNHRRGVERSGRFAGPTSVRPRDFVTGSMDAGSELPTPGNFVLPEAHPNSAVENRICGGLLGFTPKILEAGWQGTAAVDFNLPQSASLIVSPGVQRAQETDPTRILPEHPHIFSAHAALEMNAGEPREAPVPLAPVPVELRSLAAQLPGKKSIEKSLRLSNDLRAVPAGRGTLFFDQPACSGGFSWRSAGPVLEPFSIALWENQPVACHLPVSMAHGGTMPAFPRGSLHPIGWPELECTPVRRSDPQPSPSPAGFTILAPAPFSIGTELVSSPLLAVAPRRAFSMPPSALFEGMNLPPAGSTALLRTVEWPVGTLRIDRGCAMVNWNARVPAVSHSPAAKMLPIRKGPILPAARSWPRLGAMPG